MNRRSFFALTASAAIAPVALATLPAITKIEPPNRKVTVRVLTEFDIVRYQNIYRMCIFEGAAPPFSLAEHDPTMTVVDSASDSAVNAIAKLPPCWDKTEMLRLAEHHENYIANLQGFRNSEYQPRILSYVNNFA